MSNIKLKNNPELVAAIEAALNAGDSVRGAAREVLGSESRESTIRYAIKRGDVVVGEETTFIAPEMTFVAEQHEVEPTAKKPLTYKKVKREFDNSRILVISDLHIPYNHQDSLEFLQHLADKYNPTRIICLGDELDKHSLSFHQSDPDLSNAGDELQASLPVIKQLETMFPEMDILDSNHGSMVWRKAKHHGIPRHYIKGYNDVLGVGDGWQWHNDMTIKLPNGQYCYFHHGKTNNIIRLSQQMGMNCVQGHYHESFKIDYWGNATGLYWGMQAACLIDDDSYAFSYNNVNIKRPIIGTGLIIDSLPVLEPMVLDKKGRWVGRKK